MNNSYQKILCKQQEALRPLTDVERIENLKKLKQMLVDYEDDCVQALKIDLHKSGFEAFATEIAVLLNEIDYMIKRLSKWMKTRRLFRLKLGYWEDIRKTRRPYGSVLIISPWNYPLQLALMPVVNALAAGNHCVIKPSEHAPATSQLLKDMIDRTFPPEQVTVVLGGSDTAKQLTALPFNLIFFTGGQEVGKAVSRQAAQQLVPVVLELGGKNPCIIDETGYSKKAIREIVWGKFLNAGQTCIAPDTLYVHRSVYEKTINETILAIKEFYGEDPSISPNYGRICHIGHFRRVQSFLSGGDIVYGGQVDERELYIAPTVLTNVEANHSLIKEEIFGPVLPIIPYTNLSDLLNPHNIRKDALVAYIFTHDRKNINMLKQYSHSTVVSVNQVIQHAANPAIPFGGIGSSGHGAYHGKAGFDLFSYETIDYQVHHYLDGKQKYPPYTSKEFALLKKLRKWLL